MLSDTDRRKVEDAQAALEEMKARVSNIEEMSKHFSQTEITVQSAEVRRLAGLLEVLLENMKTTDLTQKTVSNFQRITAELTQGLKTLTTTLDPEVVSKVDIALQAVAPVVKVQPREPGAPKIEVREFDESWEAQIARVQDLPRKKKSSIDEEVPTMQQEVKVSRAVATEEVMSVKEFRDATFRGGMGSGRSGPLNAVEGALENYHADRGADFSAERLHTTILAAIAATQNRVLDRVHRDRLPGLIKLLDQVEGQHQELKDRAPDTVARAARTIVLDYQQHRSTSTAQLVLAVEHGDRRKATTALQSQTAEAHASEASLGETKATTPAADTLKPLSQNLSAHRGAFPDLQNVARTLKQYNQLGQDATPGQRLGLLSKLEGQIATASQAIADKTLGLTDTTHTSMLRELKQLHATVGFASVKQRDLQAAAAPTQPQPSAQQQPKDKDVAAMHPQQRQQMGRRSH